MPARDTARAMSEENVEIVLGQWDAWNNADLDRWAEAWDSEVVVVAPKGWPEGEAEHGLDAWRRQAQRLRDTWGDARVEVDEIRDVKDHVLARIRYVTRGADTGIPFETPMGVVLFLNERKITRGYFGWTMAEALEAAGLSE
jgi:ketosteroid isomerase-like protein